MGNKYKNLNATLDNTFEPNYRGKYNLRGKYTYKELISLLHSDNVKEKHFAILELDEIHSQDDARALVSNLVGQDGKVREAVAFKINELVQNSSNIEFFLSEEIFDIIVQGIMDINGNICRQTVSSKLFDCKEFKAYLCKKLPENINKILKEIENFDSTSKQYVISKRNFQLYWCLEALHKCAENVEFLSIKNILLKTGVFYDYTIREKTAKILAKLNYPELDKLKEKLKNDENYYVRRYLVG